MKKKIRRIAVYTALVENQEGKILMTQRHEPELPKAHNKWELPGGKKRKGETPHQAIERELLEETGYEVVVGEPIGESLISEWDYPTFHQITTITCYLAKLKNTKKKQVTDHHIKRIEWVDKNEALKLPSLPGVVDFIWRWLESEFHAKQ
jgi:8-oxo-dGTP diphosphatase